MCSATNWRNNVYRLMIMMIMLKFIMDAPAHNPTIQKRRLIVFADRFEIKNNNRMENSSTKINCVERPSVGPFDWLCVRWLKVPGRRSKNSEIKGVVCAVPPQSLCRRNGIVKFHVDKIRGYSSHLIEMVAAITRRQPIAMNQFEFVQYLIFHCFTFLSAPFHAY